MQTFVRGARWRFAAALTAALSGVPCALAQFTISVENPAPGKTTDPPSFPLAPPRLAPFPAEVAAPPSAPQAPAARPGWTPGALLFAPLRPKVEVVQAPTGTQPPTAAEIQRVQLGQASPVEVAAAKIRLDESAVPMRRAAITYLTSVRCHYFPEAEDALISALRADRNEAVRIDAAQALAGGCCLTPKTMQALMLAVSGSERDGNPAEISERVKAAASLALQRYSAHGMTVPHPDTLPAAAKQSAPLELQLTSFNRPAEPARLNSQVVTEAERLFAETAGTTQPTAPAPRKLPKAATAPAAPLARPVAAVPEIRLTPIGVIPPRPEK